MLHYEIVAGNPSHVSHYCLVLHGLGDSLEGWKPVAAEIPVAGLAWVFCNAPDPYFGGYSWFPIPGMTGPEDDEAARRTGIERSRRLLRETIDGLCSKLQITTRQIVLMGFSQGCMMVLDQALRAERAFAGVLGISGGVALLEDYPEALGLAVAAQRILATHGRFDEMIPYDWALAGLEHLQGLAVPLEIRSYDKGHGVDPQRELPELQDFLRRCVQG